MIKVDESIVVAHLPNDVSKTSVLDNGVVVAQLTVPHTLPIKNPTGDSQKTVLQSSRVAENIKT